MQSTENQRHFLQQADPVVKRAIAYPMSFIQEIRDGDKDDLTTVQREAMAEGVSEALGSLRKILELRKGYTDDEIALVNETAIAFYKTGGEKAPFKWMVLFQEDPRRALEIYKTALETIEIAADLAKLGVSDFSEYTTSQEGNKP